MEIDPEAQRKRHIRGTILVVVGEIVLSPDSLLVRSVSHLPNYTVIFVKYSLYSATILFFYLCYNQWETLAVLKKIGYIGLIASIVWGVSNVIFMLALQNTSVATVLVILATNPIFAAVFSFLLIGEKVNLRTCLTGVVCFICIAVIFYQDIESNNDKKSTDGVIYAVFASITFGLYFTLIRFAGQEYGNEPDMNACNIVAGLVVAIITAILGVDLHGISDSDMLLLCIQGMFVVPIAFTLLIIGPQYITAPEVCFINASNITQIQHDYRRIHRHTYACRCVCTAS